MGPLELMAFVRGHPESTQVTTGHPDDIQPNRNVLELSLMFLQQPGDPQSVYCELGARHLGVVLLAVLTAKSPGL